MVRLDDLGNVLWSLVWIVVGVENWLELVVFGSNFKVFFLVWGDNSNNNNKVFFVILGDNKKWVGLWYNLVV